jgi:multidrug transporter EmrE-like cation transporter
LESTGQAGGRRQKSYLVLVSYRSIVIPTGGDLGFGAFLFAAGVLHLLYIESLLRGYRAGDLSVVYPLARGTGPLLSFFGAILLLGERRRCWLVRERCLSLREFYFCQAVCPLSGVEPAVPDCSGALPPELPSPATRWLTAILSVCFALALPGGIRGQLAAYRRSLSAGQPRRRLPHHGEEYRRHWKEALGIAVLTTAGYTLVLFAMTIAPVSHVAPSREMSMMIGAYFGIRFFGERHGTRRVIGSALIAVGVAGLALG